MIYKKKLFFIKKNRESPPQMILFHSSFHTYYKLLWKNFHFLQKSSIFALKNLNINHGKKT